jgi:hypothetical protein
MNLNEIICGNETKIVKNVNNLFKQHFLIQPDEVLCKISVVKYSYQIVNGTNL